MKKNYLFILPLLSVFIFSCNNENFNEKEVDTPTNVNDLIKNDWYRRLGRRDISIFGKWKKDFIWEQTQLNFTDASRAMKIVMNIYQN